MENISRQDAMRLGKHLYFTGRECRNGHVAARYVQSSTCVECLADSNKRGRDAIQQVLPRSQHMQQEVVQQYDKATLSELACIPLRTFDHRVPEVNKIAVAIIMGRYPSVSEAKILAKQPKGAGTKRTHNSGIQKYYVPADDAKMFTDLVCEMFRQEASRGNNIAAMRAQATAAASALNAPEAWPQEKP